MTAPSARPGDPENLAADGFRGEGYNAVGPAAHRELPPREPVIHSLPAPGKKARKKRFRSGFFQFFEGILEGTYPPVPPFQKALPRLPPTWYLINP